MAKRPAQPMNRGLLPADKGLGMRDKVMCEEVKSRPFDEEFDVQMEVEENPCGALMAIHTLVAENEALQAEIERLRADLAEAEVASKQEHGKIKGMRKILNEMALQPPSKRLSDPDADYQGAYDQFILRARKALEGYGEVTKTVGLEEMVENLHCCDTEAHHLAQKIASGWRPDGVLVLEAVEKVMRAAHAAALINGEDE